MLIIGIDPGVNTGYAVFDISSNQFIEVSTYKLHTAILRTIEYIKADEVRLIFEDSRTAIYKRNTEEQRSRLKGAGSVNRDSKIWEEFTTDYNIDYIKKRPNKGLNAFCKNVKHWKALTGYNGRTSHHSRIAATLAIQNTFGAKYIKSKTNTDANTTKAR